MKKPSPNVVKTVYYGNWSDVWGFPLAARILPYVIKIPFLTPNVITLIGFSSVVLGSILLFLPQVPYNLFLSAFLLPFGFFMDELFHDVDIYFKLEESVQ